MKDIQFFSKNLLKYERGEHGLEVSGYAIHTGIYQSGTVEIPATELKNIAETMKGKHVIKDHELKTDNIVGRVLDTRTAINANVHKRGVKYRAFVDDPKLEKQIEKGLVDSLSIGFSLAPECSECGEDFRECPHWFDSAHVIARDCSVHELSVVPIPADSNTTIEPGAAFSAQEDFTAQFSKQAKEAITLTKKQTPPESFITTTTTGQTDGTYTIDVPGTDNQRYTINGNPEFKFIYSGNTQKPEDGENMETELKEQVEQLEEEKADLLEKIEQLEAEKGELEEEVDILETEKAELSESLETYKEAEAEAVQLAHEALVSEVIELQVEKGILDEEEAEAKFEELAKFDTEYLEQTKEMLSKIEKETPAREKPPVGEFDAQKEEPALPEATEFDMEDEELRRKMFKAMFKY